MIEQIAFWTLAVLTLAGALGVVLVKDVMRLVISLGTFLLGVAGWFLYFGNVFLAAAQVFIYVGGVLILVLFAIMLVHRSEAGSPELESRHGPDSLLVAIGMLVLVSQALSGVWGGIGALREDTGNTLQNLAATLLGSDAGPGAYTSQFGAIGLLLLAALVAAIVILGGERK